MRSRIIMLLLLGFSLLFFSCGLKQKNNSDRENFTEMLAVNRYDRLQARYLTAGDFSALQEMNTKYPIETRTLIEKVLQIGPVEDYETNNKFLTFYQDTLLQSLILDVEREYISLNDVNKRFFDAFGYLLRYFPDIPIPTIYSQIGDFSQSIIVGDRRIGISLDKYMGSDYKAYKKYYSESQRQTMTRQYIVPDAICYYLLSLYGMSSFDNRPQLERDLHMGKIMWVTNQAVQQEVYRTKYVDVVDKYMRKHPYMSIKELLEANLQGQLMP